LTREQALQVQQEIERVCNKYGVWCKVEHDKRPDLKMITFREITIKITEAEK
jgi:hypothetical protein